jgi:hypothetical protein
MKLYLLGMMGVFMVMAVRPVLSETSMSMATLPVSAGVTIGPIVDNFDDGAGPNFWVGGNGAFSGGSGTPVAYSSYSLTEARGGAGRSFALTFSMVTAGQFAGLYMQLAPGSMVADVSGYSSLRFWVKGNPALKSFKIEAANDSGDPTRARSSLYLTDYMDGGLDMTWREVVIPLGAFANLDSLTNWKEIVFSFEYNYATAHGNAVGGILYIDDVSFSVSPETVLRQDHFGDNLNRNALGGNMGDMGSGGAATHTTTFDSGTFHAYGRSLRSDYNVTPTGSWVGLFSLFGGGTDGWTAQPMTLSSYSRMTLWVRALSDATNPEIVKIELPYEGGVGSFYIPFASTTPDTMISPTWTKYDIPFANISGLQPSSVRQLNIIYVRSLATNKVGTLFFDEIQFE